MKNKCPYYCEDCSKCNAPMTNIEKWEEEFDGLMCSNSPLIASGAGGFFLGMTSGVEIYDFNQIKSFIRTLLQTEQTRIAEEVEKTSIEWEDSKDELYTYFGKCSCGETSVIVGSKYCYGCGKLIKNPLRSSESLSIIKQGK